MKKNAKKFLPHLILVALIAVVFFSSRDYRLFVPCGRLSSDKRTACAEQRTLSVLHASGPEAAIAELQRLLGSTDYKQQVCHPIVHKIGEEVYFSSQGGDLGKLFGIRGGDYCASGYYHGIMTAAFQKIENPIRLCSETKFVSEWGKQSCFHGLGHGAMVFYQYDLPRALAFCGRLSGLEWDLCTSGAFMENFVPMHGTPHVSSTDPLSPCASIDKRYAVNCYNYAVRRLLRSVGGSFSEAVKTCVSLPPETAPWCMRGVGEMVAIRVAQGIISKAEGNNICSMVSGADAVRCVKGAARGLVVDDVPLNDVVEFCRLSREDLKKICFNAAAAIVYWFPATPEEKKWFCDLHEVIAVGGCRATDQLLGTF